MVTKWKNDWQSVFHVKMKIVLPQWQPILVIDNESSLQLLAESLLKVCHSLKNLAS